MAAGLALSKAEVTVTPPAGEPTELSGVSVLVRQGAGVAKRGRLVEAEAAGVVSVAPTSRKSWLVTYSDGTTWAVTKAACVPCTGRR